MNEEWRPVIGWEGLYEVSDCGRVRSAITGRQRSLSPAGNGYPMVTLKSGRRMNRTCVHRLVAAAFLGPSNGLCVNHRDGARDNNSIANLEYVTYQENERHKYRVLGRVHHRAVLDADSVVAIRNLAAGGMGYAEIARITGSGLSPESISNAVRRKTWRHVA